MSWINLAVGAGALLVGLLVGVVVGWVLHRREAALAAVEQVAPTVPTELPDDIAELLTLMRAPSVVVGRHDEILHSSVQARTLGIVRGSRIGIDEVLHEVREVRRTGEPSTRDLELIRGTGAPATHLTIRTATVGDRLVVVVAEDRTAARRIDETRRDFVANVSHELKTPIGAISLLAEAIADAADDPEAVRRFSGRLSQESTRLTELTKQIIDLSRLQSDDPMLRAAEVSIDSVIGASVRRTRELAEAHHVTVHVAGQHDLVCMGDPAQLTDAVTNLVHNAIVYSDEGARVAVSARAVTEDGEQWVDLAVSDNGIGIAPADLTRIFERFYRVDYARSRANGGTGLGLSIVKHIATVHGGTVSVWSQPGQGSTFTLRLPILVDPDSKENP